MKKIKINYVDYEIPNTWMDITIQKFLEIKEHEKTSLKLKDESYDLTDFSIKFISILTGIPRDVVLSMKPDDFTDLYSELIKFTKSDIKKIEIPCIWKYENRTFVLDTNTQNMSIGQFIDLENIIKEGDVFDNGNKICASFLREVKNYNSFLMKGKKILKKKLKLDDFKLREYSYEDVLENAQLFYYFLPMPYVVTCIDFFLSLEKISRQNIQNYTHKSEEVI